jgi:hypothetical protein
MLMDYPKLRNIDIFPFDASGQKAIGLRDPAIMNDRVLVISYPAFFLVSLFDGTRSLQDIKTEYMRKYGRLFLPSSLRRLLSSLMRIIFWRANIIRPIAFRWRVNGGSLKSAVPHSPAKVMRQTLTG